MQCTCLICFNHLTCFHTAIKHLCNHTINTLITQVPIQFMCHKCVPFGAIEVVGGCLLPYSEKRVYFHTFYVFLLLFFFFYLKLIHCSQYQSYFVDYFNRSGL